MSDGGRLTGIWVKRAKGGPMDAAFSAELVAGRGIVGNADQGRRRQVTLIDAAMWRRLTGQLGSPLDPSRRRANLMLERVDLAGSRGKVLRIGSCVLRIAGETKPCEQMDAALRGLKDLMWADWGGGAFAEVLTGGEIHLGDEAAWLPADPSATAAAMKKASA